MLSTQNLTFSYTPQTSFAFPDIRANTDSPTLIVGNSGQGKTTLLHLMGMLLSPKSGTIEINKQEITGFSSKEIARFRAENIGLVFQQPHFISSLNVIDNLLITNYLINKNQDISKAKKLANELGFEHILKNKISQLSGGEQQRVGIARALMNSPKIVLADEPTSSLDDENCERVIRLLTKQTQSIGAALVIVTHDGRLKERFEKQVVLV